ncbi:MAG: alpha/beta hydrolase [Paludibacteraceae bacterium]|nr:alpha/beta hydrolase [Paludibacteraceae bacterium]
MKKYHLFIAAVLLTLSAGLTAADTYAYVERDSTLYLDIYSPATQANGYTILHVFGGGFFEGARTNKWDTAYCHSLTELGYRAVAIDYRLGLRGVSNVGITNLKPLENAFYMAAADCSAAVRYLVSHADELGIAPDKIILEGSSAGAITVLMTDYGRCNALDYTAELPEGWKPAAVVAYSGAIYSTHGALKWSLPPAPTLLFHGMLDKIVTYKKITFGKLGLYGANAIVKRLAKFDYPYSVYRVPGLGHEVSMAGPMTLDELDLFVRQRLINHRTLFKDAILRDTAVHPTKWTTMTVSDLYKKK